ncbi:MAG: type IX secretion system membrane protein PorP/SprF [Bacteroidia bacterium]
MKNTRLILLLFVLVNSAYSQHTNQYSQYMFNGLVINPAFAGADDALDATILCRNQWVGLEGAPKTASLSIHTPLVNKKLNVGISLISDNYGITHKNIFTGVFAYKIRFRESSVSFGIQGGADISRNNWDLVKTTEAGDNTFMGQKERSVIPVAGAGIYYRAKKYYAGFSSPSLLQFGKESRTVYKPFLLNAGYILKCSENIVLKPSILAKYIRNAPLEMDLNLNAYYKNAGLGVSYRTNDAFVFLLDYSVREQLRVGYAYDLTFSKLRTYNKGSHEIMLRYEFGYKVNTVSPRYF